MLACSRRCSRPRRAGERGVRQILAVRRAGDVEPGSSPAGRASADRLDHGAFADAHAAFEVDHGPSARTQTGKASVHLLQLGMTTKVALDCGAAAHAVGLTEDHKAAYWRIFAANAH